MRRRPCFSMKRGRFLLMHLPRRGEIAAYVAKLFDVPFGAEQKRISRMRLGDTSTETANTVAKLLAGRINQLFVPSDVSSPADEIETKMRGAAYGHFFNTVDASKPLEFIWRDSMKFFLHHGQLAARTKERSIASNETCHLDLEIYLFHFVLPVIANNLVKYRGTKAVRFDAIDMSAEPLWFLPTVEQGRADCVTPMARAITWLRSECLKIGADWLMVLCPDIDMESANREIERWRAGDVVPSSCTLCTWCERFEGDRFRFRQVFHLAAATTRMWRDVVKMFGHAHAVKINRHLRDLVAEMQKAHDQAAGLNPDFSLMPEQLRRCFTWIYSGPDYAALCREMQVAYISGRSPFG